MISGMIESMKPFPDETYAPRIEGSEGRNPQGAILKPMRSTAKNCGYR
jgi:hypothetical protein